MFLDTPAAYIFRAHSHHKTVATNFPRNIRSCLHGGIFQNTIFLRNLLNDDQSGRSMKYIVMVPGGWGLREFIHSLISTKSMQGDMFCMNRF